METLTIVALLITASLTRLYFHYKIEQSNQPKPVISIYYIVMTNEERKALEDLKVYYESKNTEHANQCLIFLNHLISGQEINLGNYAKIDSPLEVKENLYNAFQEIGTKLRHKRFKSFTLHSVPDEVLAQ